MKGLPIKDRLLGNRRITPDGCWEWTKLVQRYGVIRIGNKCKKVHRVSWEEFIGPIPNGLCVCHKCDNGPCFNPEHLFLGTQKDNVVDCKIKGRLVPPVCPDHKKASGKRNGMRTHPRILCSENNGRSKLTNQQRFAIANKMESGIRRDLIAKEYGVHITQVFRARKWVQENATADAILLAEYARRSNGVKP